MNRRENTFTILLVNMRGYKSKERSLMNVIKKRTPSIVTLNETLLTGKNKGFFAALYKLDKEQK